MTSAGDPLETIAKALHNEICPTGMSMDGKHPNGRCEKVAPAVLAALLSDAGSTQWGNYGDDTRAWVRPEASEHWARANFARNGAPVVRRQVLELHGDWEDA